MTSDAPGGHLVVAAPAARTIGRLPEAAATAVLEALGTIAAGPYRVGKPLRFDLAGLHSARRGPYRVLYRIEPQAQTVTVVAVGHRDDVYRRR